MAKSPVQERHGDGARAKIRVSQSGVHIFDRTSGLNVLLDEIEPPAQLWSSAPRQVSIALTNACDLSCPYCHAPKRPATLGFEQLSNWLFELDAHGSLGVGFGGGEPTLHHQFAEICRFAAFQTGLAVTFTTHGHHLDKELIESLAGSIHFFRVSMDGVGQTYERLRGRPFSDLVGRLRQASRLAPFGINYVVNSQTLGDLDSAVLVAADVGAAELLLLPEQPTQARTGIDKHTSEELRAWVTRYDGPVRLVVSEVGSEGLPICDPFEDEPGLSQFVHIDAFGQAKRTSFDVEGVGIGDRGVIAALDTLRERLGEG